MADIAMCHGHGCQAKADCYRFRAIANEHWQSYSNFKPDESGKCDYFWEIEGRRVTPLEELKT